jgi:hypothetical protein
MGIPGLYGRWLAKNNTRIRAILNGMPPNVASLAFDLNGIFHAARMKVFAGASVDIRIQQAIQNTDPLLLETEIHNAVAAIILELVQLAQPQDCLILSVDGVAPGAKMQQQKGRRERTAYESEPNQAFDSNAITPGTEFMIRMDNFVKRFIGMYRDYLPPKIIYSSHLVPGEGEHKIMDYYRRGDVSNGPAAQRGGVHVIHGLDADFIMLSLLSPVNNIYLARETDEGLVSVQIDALKRYLLERTRRETIVDDFVIMMMLMGNDFLPHFPAFADMAESIDQLIDLYTAGDYVLTRVNENGRRSINWNDMKRYLSVVAERENTLLETVSKRKFKNPSRFFKTAVVDGVFHPERFRGAWYGNALGSKGSPELTNSLIRIISGYVPTQPDADLYGARVVEPITTLSPLTVEKIEKMAVDYMRIMAWVYLYYREGTSAINQDLAYMYYHTPMLVDLAAIAQTVGVTREITGYEAFREMNTFTALHQLVAVLPMKSKSLLPVELQPLFDYNSMIRDLLPHSFIIERDGTDQPYQGIPIVPLIDRQRILDAVAQVSFTAARAALWAPVNDEIYERSPEDAERIAHIAYQQQRRQSYLEKQQRRTRGERGAKTPYTGGVTRGRGEKAPSPGVSTRGRGAITPPRGRVGPPPAQGLVPTMETTQAVKSPSIPVRGRGTRGVTRGTRGRTEGGVVIRRPTTEPTGRGTIIPPMGLATIQPPAGMPQPLTGMPQPIGEAGLPTLTNGLPPLTGGLPPLTGGLPPLTGGLSPLPGGLAPLPGGLPPLTGGLPPLTGGLPPLTGGLPQPITEVMPVQPRTNTPRGPRTPRTPSQQKDLPLLM